MNVDIQSRGGTGLKNLRSSADGWRGLIGESFNQSSAARVVQSILEVTTKNLNAPRILVAFDCRTLSKEVAQEAASYAFHKTGVAPSLVEFLPTATASFLTAHGYDLGILVTASHNPPNWNGIKLKVAGGLPASQDLVDRIDGGVATQAWDVPLASDPPADQLNVEQPDGYIAMHLEYLLSKTRCQHKPFRVVIDGLGGIAENAMVRLGAQLGWQVVPCGEKPTFDFGGSIPDPSKPVGRERATRRVLCENAHFGIVLDGDGDRIYVIDNEGRTVMPHDLMALILNHELMQGAKISQVAVTHSTGMSVRLAARLNGLTLSETPIGFKYLAPLMQSNEAGIAGGAVGDLAVKGWSTDRDPYAVAVLVSEMLSCEGRTLSDRVDELQSQLGTVGLTWLETFLQVQQIPTPEQSSHVLSELAAALSFQEAQCSNLGRGTVRLSAKKHQWLMLRTSTTENGVRLYGEVFHPAKLSLSAIAEKTACDLKTITSI